MGPVNLRTYFFVTVLAAPLLGCFDDLGLDKAVFSCESSEDCLPDYTCRDNRCVLDFDVSADADDAATDSPTTCEEGAQRCGGACVDVSVSEVHCGACDSPCESGACVNGACQRCDLTRLALRLEGDGPLLISSGEPVTITAFLEADGGTVDASSCADRYSIYIGPPGVLRPLRTSGDLECTDCDAAERNVATPQFTFTPEGSTAVLMRAHVGPSMVQSPIVVLYDCPPGTSRPEICPPDDACVDLFTDPKNCGSCENPCDEGEFCADGLCMP